MRLTLILVLTFCVAGPLLGGCATAGEAYEAKHGPRTPWIDSDHPVARRAKILVRKHDEALARGDTKAAAQYWTQIKWTMCERCILEGRWGCERLCGGGPDLNINLQLK